MTKVSHPLKWHGGKSYLSKSIISLMPRHLHYVEPYGGGLAVLLDRDPFDRSLFYDGDPEGHSYHQGVSEVVNDINRRLTNFWRVLQDKESFADFKRIIEVTPFSQVEWDEAGSEIILEPTLALDVKAAVAFFIRCRQSLAGRFKGFTPLSRTRTRRSMNEQVSAWLSSIDGLEPVSQRLRRVVILNDEATAVMKREDSEYTLFYCDPTYLPETRVAKDAYEHEMTPEQHEEFLGVAKERRGIVMISGYPSEMYNKALVGWKRHDFIIDNKAAGGDHKRKMVESLWINR